MAAANAAKKALRALVTKRIASMSLAERAAESAAVQAKMLADPLFQEAQSVAVYLAMDTEVDTTLILETLLKTGRRCYIPYYKGSTMEMLRVHSMEELHTLPLTRWNIRQHSSAEGCENALDSPEGLDVMIVPCLGITLSGDRLGHGAGYYDKYLCRYAKWAQEHNRPSLSTVAIALSAQVCDEVPTTELDFHIDRVYAP